MNRKTLVVLGAALVALLAVVGVTVSATGDSAKKDEAPSPASYVPAPDNLKQFAVLSNDAGEALPAELHAESLPIEPGSARKLVANDKGTSWISADDKTMCLSLQITAGGATAGCRPTHDAAKGFAMVSGDPDKGIIVAGIAPDGVKQVDVELKDGEHQAIAVEGNGFLAQAKGPTKSLSYDTPAGPFSEPLPSFDK
jgi:hypothetical protein